MNIQGGALEFEVLFKNGQIDGVLKETERRVKDFTDATVSGGTRMEAAYRSATKQMDAGFEMIGSSIKANREAIESLRKTYDELGVAAGEAFSKGKDRKYSQLENRRSGIQDQISEHRKVVVELDKAGVALEKYAKGLNDQKSKVDNASNAQVRFRTQLLNVKNEMSKLERAGKMNTDEYARLTEKAKGLANVMYSTNQQIKTLTTTKGVMLQGFVSGISGLSGAFTAAQGAIGLFAGKNEELQKIMLKVQSLMSITMGLQAVSATLHQTSAFRIAVVAKVQAAYSAALNATNKAQAANTAAAAAGTVANTGLAGAFRLVGAAIKSIPVFGWIAAGIGVLIGVITHFSSKAREAKKAVEEFHKAVAESAGKPIAAFRSLRAEWDNAGDSFQKKMSVIKDLKKMFEDLGVSINGVIDAEKILTGPDNVNAFIAAQIAKARVAAKQQEIEKLAAEANLAQQKLEEAQKTPKVKRNAGSSSAVYFIDVDNPEIARQKKALQDATDKMTAATVDMGKYQKKAFEEAQKATEGAIINYADGTVGAIEQAIKEENEALEGLKGDNEAYRKKLDEIAALQKKLDEITGKNTNKRKKKTEKDPVTEQIEQAKKSYREYFKWVNAGYQNEAKQEFSELLKGGKTYLDYLKKMLKDTSLTKKQIHQITNEIANETNTSVLGEFENSLKDQLSNAQTVLGMMEIIEQKRKELAKTTEDDDPLKGEKEKIITEQEKSVVKEQEERTKRLIAEYSDYLDKKIMLETEFNDEITLLEKKRAKSTSENDRKAIGKVIDNRKKKYEEDKENLLRAGYEATKKIIDLEQDEALLSISKKAFTWEADRQKAMLEEQKKAAEKTISELKKMQEQANTPEIAEEIAELTLEVEKLNAELGKIPAEKFQEILSGLQKITSALGNIDGEIGEMFSSIGSQIDSLQTVFSDTASKTDKISAGIAAVVDIINMLTSASAKRKQAEREFYQNQIALVHEYALALNEQLRIQSELSGSGFITDYAGKIEDGFNALSDATEKYQSSLAELSKGKAKVDLNNAIDWGNVGKGAAAGAVAGAAIGSIIPVIGTAIGAAAGAIIGGLAGLFGGKKKKNEYAGLMEVFPNLVDEAGNLNRELAQTLINTGQLNDETSQLVQNALDWADAVEEAAEQIKEVVVDLAGDLGNSMKDAIVKAWESGEDASKKMFEAASKSLGKFVQDLIFSVIFSDVFKRFEDDLTNSFGISGDGDVVDDYDRFMADMEKLYPLYTSSLDAINERAKALGMDFKSLGGGDQSGLSGAIKGITQEQADIIGGTANAMRVNQVESMEILRNQLLYLASIDLKIGISNQHLESIDSKMGSGNYNPLRAEGITN
jgi:hypothetical protein